MTQPSHSRPFKRTYFKDTTYTELWFPGSRRAWTEEVGPDALPHVFVVEGYRLWIEDLRCNVPDADGLLHRPFCECRTWEYDLGTTLAGTWKFWVKR